ncbi:MAG: CAP domain-containing protein [Bacteroidales bacterium]|nr:CAP domain-containing protein [Bacteroidales bacterium]
MKELVLVLVVFATILGKAQDFNYGTYSDVIFKQLDLINELRAEHGLQPLVMDSVLFKAARHRCEEIGQKFDHERPNGKRFETILRKQTLLKYTNVGENITKGVNDVNKCFNGFYNSRGHRENMLSPYYNCIGICCNPIKGRWVQFFGYKNIQ